MEWDFLDSCSQFGTTDGDLTRRRHAQSDPASADLDDGDFDVPGNDNPLADLA